MSDSTQFDSRNPVVPQQNNSQPAAPDVGQGSVPGDPSAQAIGGSQPRPPIPTGSQPNTDPNAVPGTVEPSHGMLASIFQDIAGGKKTTYRQTENGPVPVKENLQPGEIARNILAAALTGLAAGYKTRGGPGGNKGQAAAAGFEAVEKQRDKQETQKKQEAQQEFQNKNVADEMTLRKMQNARDQQRSIDQHQESTIRLEQMSQDYAQGKIRNAHENEQYFLQQQNDWNLSMAAGMRPLDGSPEFSSNEELTKWLETNAKTAIQPGKYNTVIKTDPYTGRYVIMQKPKGWDDPQWLGVKVDAKGNPVRDKDGNMEPNGDFKGPNGKPRVPAGQMTPHQLYESQVQLLDLRNKEISREEALERIKALHRENAKNQELDKAQKEWDAAAGNPDAIDPKTGNFVMSPTSRNILRQTFNKELTAQSTSLHTIQQDMEKMGAPGRNATPEEKQQWDDLNYQATEARKNLHQIQTNLSLLGRVPNVADITAGNIRSQFTKDDGSYDEAGALKAADAITAPSAVKQQIRKGLSSEIPNRPETQLTAVLDSLQTLPQDQVADHIAHAALSKHDKDWLLSRIKVSNEKSLGLDKVPPTMTVMKAPDGKTINVSNGDTQQWIDNGYKTIGQGTMPGDTASDKGHVVH